MEWSRNLKALGQGVRLAKHVIKARLASPPVSAEPAAPLHSRLVGFEGFGDNPGKLRMLAHIPASGAGRPLVVLLHGCGQDAATFAADSGWMDLAEKLGVPLILPQQAEANNATRCFRWFRPDDVARDQGEAGSIAAMTRAAMGRFGSDPRRIFVVGLSAGGAMAAALLAAYPDLFAAGAVVAGVPVGAARSGMQALLRMASPSLDVAPEDWASHVKQGAPRGFAGPWPRLSIWQGQADNTVSPGNAPLLAEQWRALLGLPPQATIEQRPGGISHQYWTRGAQSLLESWLLPHFPHAYPVADRKEAPNRFIAAARVDATLAIANFFHLD